MDPLAELLKTAQDDRKPMRHRMRAAHQALRAMSIDVPEEVWRPFRDLFDEVVQHQPPYAEALRADAANVALWWDGRRRPSVTAELGGGWNSEPNGNGSAALQQLRTIMGDPSVALYKRLSAAEVILQYELGPAGAAGAAVSEIAAGSYRFLKAMVDSPGTPETLKFRALRSIVSVENVRAQVKSTVVEHDVKRRLQIALVNAERGRVLRAAGVWKSVVKRHEQWALEVADEFDWLLSWPGSWSWPPSPMILAMPLEQGHDVENFRRQLLSIRATNRADRWEDLLRLTAALS